MGRGGLEPDAAVYADALGACEGAGRADPVPWLRAQALRCTAQALSSGRRPSRKGASLCQLGLELLLDQEGATQAAQAAFGRSLARPAAAALCSLRPGVRDPLLESLPSVGRAFLGAALRASLVRLAARAAGVCEARRAARAAQGAREGAGAEGVEAKEVVAWTASRLLSAARVEPQAAAVLEPCRGRASGYLDEAAGRGEHLLARVQAEHDRSNHAERRDYNITYYYYYYYY